MPTITFIQYDGRAHKIEAEIGQSVMQVAVDNQIPGILGDCGGNCSCGTCHGYVDKASAARIPAADSYERDLLSCASSPTEDSRLTCQIIVTDALDGMIIHLPESQY
jgi:2Fe-2S ferredoxin